MRLAILAAACLLASRAVATDVYVDATMGSDAADGVSWATAKATVNSGLSLALASPEPDVIRVAEGTYVEALFWQNHGITLLGGFPSGGGPADPARHRTVMVGSGQSSIVNAQGMVADCAVDGMTFMGEAVGPLLACRCPNIRVTRCAFLEHQSWFCGPALWVDCGEQRAPNGVLLIEDCRFADNCAPQGEVLGRHPTALHIEAARVATLRRCTFEGNTRSPSPDIVDVGTEVGSWPAMTIEDVAADSVEIEATRLAASNVLIRKRLYSGASAFNPYEYSNLTAGQVIDTWDTGEVTMRNSIVTGVVDGVRVPAMTAWRGTPAVVAQDCIIAGGWPGVNVLDVDPLLVSGPQGDHYLAHVATGHPATSPAVDAGGGTASDAGVDDGTTRIDSVLDSGTVDMGYHFPPTGMLTIRRGTTPDGLSAHATTDRLPWTDAPGIASDASLNPLFYDIPEAANEIFVQRDAATDSLTLTWR